MPEGDDLEAGGASVPGSVKSTKSTLTVSAVDVVDGEPPDVRRSDKRWNAPAKDDGGDGDAPSFTAGSPGGFEVAEVASPEMSPEPQPRRLNLGVDGKRRSATVVPEPTSSSDGAPPGFGGDGESEAPPPPSSLASGHPKLLFLHSLSSRAMVGGPNFAVHPLWQSFRDRSLEAKFGSYRALGTRREMQVGALAALALHLLCNLMLLDAFTSTGGGGGGGGARGGVAIGAAALFAVLWLIGSLLSAVRPAVAAQLYTVALAPLLLAPPLLLFLGDGATVHGFDDCGGAEDGASALPASLTAVLSIALLLQLHVACVVVPLPLWKCAGLCATAVAVFVAAAFVGASPWAAEGTTLLLVMLLSYLHHAYSRERSMRTSFLDHRSLEERLQKTKRDNLKLKRQMSRISSFYTPFLKYKHQDVELVSPMEHVLNLLRSFHNTLVENGQDGSQLDEVIKIFDPANQRYDPARRGSLWRVDVEEKLTQQEEKGELDIDASTKEWLITSSNPTAAYRREKRGGAAAVGEAARKDSLMEPGATRRNSLGESSLGALGPLFVPQPPPQALDLLRLKQFDTWDFDVTEYDALCGGRSLSLLFCCLLHEHSILERFHFDEKKLMRFLEEIEQNYGGNPYHNRRHGADVLLGMHLFLTKYWNVDLLSDVQLFAALFAAMVHDFYHPGTNNAHEIKVSSAKALEYSDDAPLEHHHLASAFKVLHRHNFLRPGMSREDYRTFRALTIEMVLATDLSKHFDFISQLKVTPEAALSPEGHTSQSSLDVNLLLTVAIKFVDIGHSYKPWAQHEQWSHWVTEEFFALGDKERSEEWAVSPLCDREKDGNLPKNQCGFFEFLCFPYYKAVVRILPKAEPVLRRLESNFEMWKKLKEGTARGSFNGGRASKAKGEAPLAVTDT